ncbi:MAG: hypothetical protein COB04_01960 [Gammaproteobacteria bacterium]|nr:MAG: hypothetical protein COB04_01960 [Gammaproteobacteria bacterium]
MEVPYQQLSKDALNHVIEEFVGREGTDYGDREWTLAEKVNSVLEQLRRGQAVILYDEDSETCTIAATESLLVS